MSHPAENSATTWTTVRPATSLTGPWSQFRNMVRLILQDVPWWSLLFPACGIALICWASGPGLASFVGKYAWTGKDCQEVLGPSVLAAAVAIGAYLSVVHPQRSRLWLLALPTLLLARELHWPGTGGGVFVGLLAWLIAALRSPHIARFWQASRMLRGTLAGTLGLYVIAWSIDTGLWKWLPHSAWWSVNVEETVETLCHASLLVTLLLSSLVRRDQEPMISCRPALR